MKKVYKNLLCLIISAMMVIGTIPAFEIVSEAADIVYTSEDGKWQYTKEYNDYRLYERGVYQATSAKLVRYLGNEINVNVPEKVDGYDVFEIGEKCFYGALISSDDIGNIDALDAIKSISIGPDVYEIYDEAFAYMDSLEEVSFSEERASYSYPITLYRRLFAETKNLASLELPKYREYEAFFNPFEDSYIKTLTSPGDILMLAGRGLIQTRIEKLIITGKTAFRADGFSYLYDNNIKSIEFEGEIYTTGGTVAEPNKNKPDLIFHHIPSLYIESELEESGYIKNYDSNTGIVSFSVDNTLDLTYFPSTDPLISGDFEYSLTSEDKAVITGYFGNEEHLTYPAEIDGFNVIAIGDNQSNDSNKTSVLSVKISEGIEYIGKNAFKRWDSLEEVHFPNSLRIIESNAFAYCQTLNEILLPDIFYLGGGAFFGCRASRISIPGTLKEIPAQAFQRTQRKEINDLQELSIAEGVESIDERAFYNSDAKDESTVGYLTLNLPSTIKYIGDKAFYKNCIVGDISIPNGVEAIGNNAFGKIQNINAVNLPDGLLYIGESAFENCTVELPITIPDSVIRICPSAFCGLTAPTVIIPQVIKVVESKCFYEAVLDYIILPDGINEISDQAFAYSVIGDLTVPSSVSHYGDGFQFAKCQINNMTFGSNIIRLAQCLIYMAEISNLSFSDGTKTIPDYAVVCSDIDRVDLSGIEVFGVADSFAGCRIEELEISESITIITYSNYQDYNYIDRIVFNAKRCKSAKNFFTKIRGLTEFSFGNSVEYIPEGLFLNSPYDIPATIPQSVKRIYDDAFKGTTITEVNLPDNLEYIGKYAFADCTGLVTITIPEKVNTIGAAAFYGCSSLESVHFLPEGCNVDYDDVEKDKGIFEGCQNLRTFIFGNAIKYLPDYLFKGFTNIESITIPDSVTDIGSYTFANTNLKSIIIPESVESIGDGCFENCKELENIVINGNVFLIGDNAFSGCDKLREIYIADSVKDIGRTSFSGCTSLETVYMSRNVVYIPEKCFENCTALSSFTWEADSKLIGKLAFAGCTSLETFNFIGIEKLYPNSFQGSGIGVASLGEAQDEAAAALEIVEAQSFMDCPELQTVALGGNVNTVQTRAFANCENLETAIISDSVETISSDAFENCPKLTIYCSEDSYAYNYAKANNINVSTFVVAPIPNQRYTGKELEPAVSVTVSGAPLSKGEDFKVKYSDNINVGTATVKVSGINTYKMFSSIVNFAILTRDISEAEIDSIADQHYTGSEITPALRVIYNGKLLREGSDYKVIYTNNTAAGKAKATVTGIGNFSGTTTAEFNITENGGETESPILTFFRNVASFISRVISFFISLFK